MIVNILLTFKKKVRFPNASRFQTEDSYPLNYHCKQIHYLKDILQIINNLDPNKAHNHNKISILMLNICGDSICRPLNIIFKTYLRTGKFPLECKIAKLFQFKKKGGDKQTVINYRPISLLPIRGKIFEQLLYNEMVNFF